MKLMNSPARKLARQISAAERAGGIPSFAAAFTSEYPRIAHARLVRTKKRRS